MIIERYFAYFSIKTYVVGTPGDYNEYPQHNICCGYSLESPLQGNSNEYPQHTFLWRTDENYTSIIIKYPPYLIYSTVYFYC